MAFHTVWPNDTAAGGLLAIWDLYLPAHPSGFWSIWDDDCGANCRVFRNYDPVENSHFYIFVNDNNAGYTIIQLWEGWDVVAHAGTGTSMNNIAGYAMYITKLAGRTNLSVREHHLIHENAHNCANYIGQPRRYDTTENMPLCICMASTSLHYNPLGFTYTYSARAGWAALFGSATAGRGDPIEAKYRVSANRAKRLRTDLDSTAFFLFDEIIVRRTSGGRTYGVLEGCTCWYTVLEAPLVYGVRDTFVLPDGTIWGHNTGSAGTKYYSAFERA